MQNAMATDLYTRACQQWREAVELDLHGSQDIIYGIIPLLVEGLSLEPDHRPSLDLLSDLLLELGDYDEAHELVEKTGQLAPDDPDYQQKQALFSGDERHRWQATRIYLRQKRLQLIGKTSTHHTR